MIADHLQVATVVRVAIAVVDVVADVVVAVINQTPKKTLVFAYGNPARGDDALGPLLLAELAKSARNKFDLIEDFQLQVEHIFDLIQYSNVIFIDADASCIAPYVFEKIQAITDKSHSSHALTPMALLHTCQQHYPEQTPSCFVLRIRGYQFELGQNLSEQAQQNLNMAKDFLLSQKDILNA